MDRVLKIKSRFGWIAITLVGHFLPMSPATAEIANEYEPEYSLAVLDFNDQKYESALKTLNLLQSKSPKTIEFLELKAITLKAMKNEKGAANAYRELIQLKTAEGKDKKETAPYAFELGVIRYNQKNWKEADQYLTFSARNGFNVDASRFYLGLANVQAQNWKRAEYNLKQTINGGVEELKPAAHYYLAQVYFKLGYPADGFGNLIDSKRSANRFIRREDVPPESKKVAEQVVAAADATLAPFDKSQFFGNFNLMLGYDSNVLLVPSEGVSPNSASGKSTLKTLVSAGAGYASSPMNLIQYVPSVRFNLNKNFNGDSFSSEFADTTFSLFITKDALAPVSYGLKTEGGLVFQNQEDASGAKKYHLYNTMLTFAPYLKWEQSKKWAYNAEIGYRALKYNGDDTLSESLRRSGGGFLARLSAQNKRNAKYFNPIYVLRAEFLSTDGTEYDSKLFGAQLINTMKLRHFDFAQVLSFDRTTYPDSSTQRADSLITLSLLATRKIGPRWALVVSGDYTKNGSSESETYSYDRFTFNAGLGYSF